MNIRGADEWFPKLAAHRNPGALHGLDEGKRTKMGPRGLCVEQIHQTVPTHHWTWTPLDQTQAHILNQETEAWVPFLAPPPGHPCNALPEEVSRVRTWNKALAAS